MLSTSRILVCQRLSQEFLKYETDRCDIHLSLLILSLADICLGMSRESKKTQDTWFLPITLNNQYQLNWNRKLQNNWSMLGR